MKIKKIKNINQFHKMVLSCSNYNPVYRGMQNSSYKLLSRVGRSINENIKMRNLDSSLYKVTLASEQNSLFDFKQYSSLYMDNKDISDLEWLAIAQHYGLPTRLMDWSTNPLVAVYFACIDHDGENNATIHVIKDIDSIEHIDYDESPFEITSVKFFNPSHTTSRIKAQSGLFTVHPNPELEYKDNNIDKWVIDKKCIVDMGIMAETYGINDASMFPSLDGVAKSVAKTYGLIIQK